MSDDLIILRWNCSTGSVSAFFQKVASSSLVFIRPPHTSAPYHMKPAYFGQCSYCLNIDKNNYPEETELDTDPSLTLARTLTLSTGERILAILRPVVVTTLRFLIWCIWIHQKNLGRDPESKSEIDSRQKITIAWNWRILLSTLTSVASDLFNYALRLDNELSTRPPRGRHGLWTGLKTQMGCLQIVWRNQ